MCCADEFSGSMAVVCDSFNFLCFNGGVCNTSSDFCVCEGPIKRYIYLMHFIELR